ncbi:DUF1648 domain-containing protein [Sporosarcina sp. 179-K 3D1 HS]|uniref:DUF1648 domain-containing protein n=1 Tax=Sporosarcina sp. 179-K 3D1 HS TaxID=3232169 RepID=UPI0039A0A52D
MINPPKLDIPRSAGQRWFDRVTMGVFLAVVIYGIFSWPALPEEVPMHYYVTGEIDGWGHKGFLFLLAGIGAFLWIILSFVEKHPETHNYQGLTEENAPRLYRNSIWLVNVMKNESLLFISYLTWKIIENAFGRYLGGGAWDMAVFLVVLFGSLGFFIYRSFKIK